MTSLKDLLWTIPITAAAIGCSDCKVGDSYVLANDAKKLGNSTLNITNLPTKTGIIDEVNMYQLQNGGLRLDIYDNGKQWSLIDADLNDNPELVNKGNGWEPTKDCSCDDLKAPYWPSTKELKKL
jgi:hypothetical protein